MAPKEQFAYSRVSPSTTSLVVLEGKHIWGHTNASNKGWGTHLRDCRVNAASSIPENKLLKVVLLALKEFEPLRKGQVVLVATDNTTVVACINKG